MFQFKYLNKNSVIILDFVSEIDNIYNIGKQNISMQFVLLQPTLGSN